MKTLNDLLRDADPVEHEPGLTGSDVERIRRAMLNTPIEAPRRPWSHSRYSPVAGAHHRHPGDSMAGHAAIRAGNPGRLWPRDAIGRGAGSPATSVRDTWRHACHLGVRFHVRDEVNP
jgi:hypothetical protein